MTFNEAYTQLKAYARIDGALLGGIWAASFACFLANFGSPLWGLLWMGLVVSTPFVAYFRLKDFRESVLNGDISFRRAFAYCFFLFLYASLILAAVQLLYFQFLDDGFILSQYNKIFSTPEMQQSMEAMGLKASDVSQAIRELQHMRPIDMTLQILISNIFTGTLLSIPLACLGMRRMK